MKRPPRRRSFTALDARKIGARIKGHRKRAGWTVAELLHVTGIPAGTLTAYECGTRVPVRDNAIRLGRAFKTPLGLLFLGRRIDRTRSCRVGSGRRGVVTGSAPPARPAL